MSVSLECKLCQAKKQSQSTIFWLRLSVMNVSFIQLKLSRVFLDCPLQVWTTALKEDSTLLLPATLAKLSVEEAASAAQLCQLLLLQHAHHLDQTTAISVYRLLLAVVLHYAAPVRQAGIQAVGDCLSEKPKLAGMRQQASLA